MMVELHILNSVIESPDMIGMIGVFLVLTAFCLLNMNRVTSHTISYQLMNLAGSMLLLFSLCFHFNLASVAIEIAWMVISLIGLYRALRTRRVLLVDDDSIPVEA